MAGNWKPSKTNHIVGFDQEEPCQVSGFTTDKINMDPLAAV
jgi:hypothetical protein